ncbi:radical SAM/SPASM domain-containing protein [Helicobacter rodentium]|uniref:radical SAM/SPASM domain-containing protein n=2 Tax=Helicobacter rodentium TaxID=59617 RepID=UPI0025AFFE9F|nr:radical SAM/SPASM domain-containing protein [Helicobacter rodentium]
MEMINFFPTRIVLELTPLCNLACSMCPRHYIKEKDGYMEERLFKKLVDEIVRENKHAIVLPFWRGESCLHPNFDILLQYALDNGLKIHLSSNGHFIEEKYLKIFYRCEFLTFSIHTPLGFENAQKIIQDKPKDCETTFQISFIDSERTTLKYLEKCISHPTLIGFDSIRLYKEHTIGGEFGKSTKQSNKKRAFCPKLINTFAVSSDGYFSRCNHIWETQKEYNLTEHTIKEVWESQVMQNIRDNYPDNLCAPCDQWSGHTCGESWRMSPDGIKHIIF